MKGIQVNFKALKLFLGFFIEPLKKWWKNRKEKGMKKLVLLAAVLLFAGVVSAEEIAFKQGVVMDWNDHNIKNMTGVEIITTKPVESWGKWNMLWSGWCVDGIWAYDASALDTVGVMIGRKIGNLRQIFDYPLLEKVEISVYPIGATASEPFNHPHLSGASGLGIINFSLKF